MNDRIQDDHYSAPNPDDILSRAANARYTSAIDLRNAYNQVKLTERSKKYTAFRFLNYSLELNRMPAGLKIASMVFQRLIDRVLRGTHSFASALIDDVIIYSDTFERKIEDVKEVLRRLADAGLTANVSKCRFVLPKLKVLGRVIEDGQIKICDDKVDAIMKLNEPRNKRQVKMILGTFGYHRAHIRDLSTIAQPLVDLLKKDQPDRVLWRPAQQSAFDDLKRQIVAKPCLNPPDHSHGYAMQTDASATAISLVLMQRIEGEERVIGYASKRLTPAQTR